MAEKNLVMIDGNTAAGHVAHALSEVISIYPITPSSPMGEVADEYSAKGKKNIWGTVPDVVEMQSEAGAAGAVHGALTTGALSTTFTASQGLLLMIPNMYKIAGELTGTVFHVAARALATSALSIFGDHQDVMACRQTGWAMLASDSVQEVMDLAVVAHSATLRSRVPFVHFFDGFRTSHEFQKIEEVSYDTMKRMMSDDLVRAHRARGLTPESPVIRGTAQNPDVYFQAREGVNKYYVRVPGIVQEEMDKYAKLTGRAYRLFDYSGAKDAEKIVIIMGSGAETCEETAEYLNARGGKTGVLKVRLFRPFDAKTFVKALPASVKAIAVLDRTKEPGAPGEPLYEDVRTALAEMQEAGELKVTPLVLGGRYGLGSKEFTPAMVKAVFDNLSGRKLAHFSVGIHDDVLRESLPVDESFGIAEEGMNEAVFYGLGSDGTVGANKNSIKIIGEAKPELNAQAYFAYDSKKSGGFTVSHLRFGPKAIRRPYLITNADFVACHKFTYMETFDLLANAKEGGTFLLNSPYGASEVWKQLPVEAQRHIVGKKLRFYVINAFEIADKAGMGARINVVMQAAYFKISGVLPEADAVKYMKKFIEKSYGKKGADVVQKNIATIDLALAAVYQVQYPASADGNLHMKKPMSQAKDAFVREVLGAMAAQEGDKLAVSKIPEDGTFPSATTQFEKRAIAERVPRWDENLCIQCGNCTVVCPHGCLRMKSLSDAEAARAPKGFKTAEVKPKAASGKKITLQVSAEDCTGCELCTSACPLKERKAVNMVPYTPEYRAEQAACWEYFMTLPEADPAELKLGTAKGLAFKRPLFEFSGACAGCGETPYLKLMSQLFGDRAVVANATGCSSIYGGNLPTTPYAKDASGRGPAWSNSLFEDAAEFGYGMRMTSDKLAQYAREVAVAAKGMGIAADIIAKILSNDQADDEKIVAQRSFVAELKAVLEKSGAPVAKELASLCDHFIKRSVWIVGGDGWAYDIGFGGLDHTLASGRDVNVLVLDTEVYSNTGGQMSKATPIGAVAKFATSGKTVSKKDLGAIAMSYGYVYVARVALGANMGQTIKAFREAESYNGPSIIVAYAHCINHGINMAKGLTNQAEAVSCGLWPLYRYDPRRIEEGKNPFQLDSKEPDYNLAGFMYKEVRFKSLKDAGTERAEALLDKAVAKAKRQYQEYKYLSERTF